MARREIPATSLPRHAERFLMTSESNQTGPSAESLPTELLQVAESDLEEQLGVRRDGP